MQNETNATSIRTRSVGIGLPGGGRARRPCPVDELGVMAGRVQQRRGACSIGRASRESGARRFCRRRRRTPPLGPRNHGKRGPGHIFSPVRPLGNIHIYARGGTAVFATFGNIAYLHVERVAPLAAPFDGLPPPSGGNEQRGTLPLPPPLRRGRSGR